MPTVVKFPLQSGFNPAGQLQYAWLEP